MILVFPLLLVVAAIVVVRNTERRPSRDGDRRTRWFAAWSVAGFVVGFSFVTGLSIGLFVLPLAAVVLLWVASRAPRPAEALGFLAGVGLLLVVIADINRVNGSLDPLPWLIAGLSLTACALLAYAAVRR